MSETHHALVRADNWMQAMPDLVRAGRLEGGERDGIAISLHHLCVERHSGIVALVQGDLLGSAFALVRPQLDAYCRALWAQKIAEESDLKGFLAGTFEPPSLKNIAKSLGDEEGPALLDLLTKSYRHLCDFTHGGVLQMKARFKQGEISTTFDDESVRALVDGSARLSYLAAMSISEVIQDQSMLEKLISLYDSVYSAP